MTFGVSLHGDDQNALLYCEDKVVVGRVEVDHRRWIRESVLILVVMTSKDRRVEIGREKLVSRAGTSIAQSCLCSTAKTADECTISTVANNVPL